MPRTLGRTVEVVTMATWEMTCSCGESMKAEGSTKEEAVDALMSQMPPEAIQAHMTEKHPGEAPPSPEQARQGMLASAQPA
jgi:hypothetical protein